MSNPKWGMDTPYLLKGLGTKTKIQKYGLGCGIT